MATSRQVRRAAERAAIKMAKATYPNGFTPNGARIQRREGFQPRGENYHDGRPLGRQEAARRLRRAFLAEAR